MVVCGMESVNAVCPYYLEEERDIRTLMRKIVECDHYTERMSLTDELIVRLGSLLECKGFTGRHPDCVSCRNINGWRKRTLEIILVMDRRMVRITSELGIIIDSLVGG